MIRQTHYAMENLSAGKKSRAIWAIDPAGRLIVFIHGWWGSPDGTWPYFPELVYNDPTGKLKGCDVVFFGYPSVWRSAEVGAGMLFDFLTEFLSSSGRHQARYFKEIGSRRHPVQYKKILLVAHSLGAVVTRLALLNAFEGHHTWVNRCRLVLFGPAHTGADLAELVRAALGLVAEPLVPLLAGFGPALRELDPGSELIGRLGKKTKDLLDSRPSSHKVLVCDQTWTGDLDKVVTRVPFLRDSHFHPVPNKGHKEVCKPDVSFMLPFTIVVNAL